MWGYTSPDSLTIPSLVALRLRDLGYQDVETLNLAQPAYNSTQGLITLLLEIRNNRRPDLVVSLDGNNDVLAELRERRAGAILGESDLALRSAIGWRGLRANLLGLLRYSALVRRLLAMAPAPAPVAPEGCDAVASQYLAVIRSAEALGREFGFRVIYAWQPHLGTSGKRLSQWERAIQVEPGFMDRMRTCTGAVAARTGGLSDSVFVSLSSLFDEDTTTVFLDGLGHLTPAGNGRVANRLADLVVRQLQTGRIPAGP
jgi:hypothetical protein